MNDFYSKMHGLRKPSERLAAERRKARQAARLQRKALRARREHEAYEQRKARSDAQS